MTLEELVGQKLVLGIEGPRATPEVIELFRETHAGGLILFRRNFESAAALRQLITDLEHALGRRLLVMVDHEGGRVIHLGEVTIFPDAQAAGEGGNAERVKQQGEIEGEELRHLGIDINLAPVLDVLTERWNPAIGTRSYGKDPALVAEMASARIKGMQSKGLSACAKHYPGLGSAEFDPHHDLPVISKNWKAMKAHDLVPFLKAIETGVDCVMSSHPIYPELDPRRLPATFSRKIIHDSLRLEFGFEGVTLTDDLKMGAITKSVSLKEAAPLAAKAGHDLLLVCSDPNAQREVFKSLVWAYKKKDLKNEELEASVERTGGLRKKRADRFGKNPGVSEKEKKELVQQIARGAAKILKNLKTRMPSSGAAIFPDLQELAGQFFIEPELLDPKNFLRRAFQPFGVALKSVETVSLNPDAEERSRLEKFAAEQNQIFFFCHDAHRFEGTRELLKGLQETGTPLAVILLREPADREWIMPNPACVTAFGFRAPQIEAALEKLFSPA